MACFLVVKEKVDKGLCLHGSLGEALKAGPKKRRTQQKITFAGVSA